MGTRRPIWLVLLLLLLLAMPAVAEQVERQDEVRLYTNADLAKFGPPSASRALTVEDDASWEYVLEFIDREYARIDAERADEIRRQRTRIEQMRARRRPVRAVGYGYYGFAHHGGRLGHPSTFSGDSPPLHSRSTLAQRRWSKAKKLSGVDAFPSNRRRAQRESSR